MDERIISSFRDAYQVCVSKRGSLTLALVKIADDNQKHQYQQQVADLKKQQMKIQRKIEELRRDSLLQAPDASREGPISIFQAAYRECVQKQGSLTLALVNAADANQRFQYQQQITDLEEQQENIRREIQEIEGDPFLQPFDPKIPLERLVSVPQTPATVTRDDVEANPADEFEDPGQIHLIVAAFLKGSGRERVWLLPPMLSYRDREDSSKIVADPLQLDPSLSDCLEDIALKDFAAFLEDLVLRASSRAIELFDPDPWTLTVELFVPLELLGTPLKYWRGRDSDILQNCRLTLRCSDRFNPASRKADFLLNQLRAGSTEFQRVAATAPLTQLNWCKPKANDRDGLDGYLGLQCCEGWLSGESQLDNWAKLVASRIPLALWVNEGQCEPDCVAEIYEQLVACTRFRFLEEVKVLWNSPSKTPDYCIGAFYEDHRYVPRIPASFEWPSS